MSSQITADISSTINWTPPSSSTTSSTDLPRAIYTAATDTAPKGRIIDDSARGTIFWEALSDDGGGGDNESDPGGDYGGGGGVDDAEEKSVSKAWGKPFRVEWLSTTRLPFYRTRGLRNNLNSGREVKVARDGTELEEVVGRRLVQMFHQTRAAGVGAAYSSSSLGFAGRDGLTLSAEVVVVGGA